MLHVWLIPILVLLAVVLLSFYFLVKVKGGPGIRTEGKTLVNKPEEKSPYEEPE